MQIAAAKPIFRAAVMMFSYRCSIAWQRGAAQDSFVAQE
jgi:hypothetical protein